MDMNKITEEILKLKENTVINLMEIGKRLLQVKENLNFGEFGIYLVEKVDFSNRSAQRYMKLYTEFSNNPYVFTIEPSKLIMLLDIKNADDRENFLQNYDIKNMSCRQITKTIKILKNRKPIPQTTIKHLINKSNGKCEICGWGGVGLEGILIPHHIYKYSKTKNNSVDNLKVICPNCHGLIHTLENCKDENMKNIIIKTIDTKIVNQITYYVDQLYR